MLCVMLCGDVLCGVAVWCCAMVLCSVCCGLYTDSLPLFLKPISVKVKLADDSTQRESLSADVDKNR